MAKGQELDLGKGKERGERAHFISRKGEEKSCVVTQEKYERSRLLTGDGRTFTGVC